MKVAGKTIIVTGGADGMGKELVKALLKKGAKVIALDLNEINLSKLKSELKNHSSSLITHVLNVADREAVFALANELKEQNQVVDGIINNAGIIQPFVKINQLEFAAIERVMNVNFYGTLNLVKAFLPLLLQRPEGHIVNISSMGGFLPVPGQSVYGASKAAVKLLTEALYAELLNTKVQVSIVFPGAVATHITENSGVAVPQMKGNAEQKYKALPAEKAAEIIISGMEKNKMRIFVGSDSSFMDFLYRLAPGFATRFISKKMKELLG